MRVVLNTNIIVSALIAPAGKPAAIIDAWLDGKFTLLTCAANVDELRATLEKSHVWPAARPIHRRLAEDIDPLPCVKRSPDPTDDFLLAPSEAGNADCPVTGDKISPRWPHDFPGGQRRPYAIRPPAPAGCHFHCASPRQPTSYSRL